MDKVYLVVSSWVCSGGEGGTYVRAFSTEKSAVEYFHHRVQIARNEDHLYKEEGVVEEYDEQRHTFSVYVDGAYCEDHYTICAKGVPIEE